MGKLDLIQFAGGPWDGEVRRMLPIPTITAAGGTYELKNKPEPTYIFRENDQEQA